MSDLLGNLEIQRDLNRSVLLEINADQASRDQTGSENYKSILTRLYSEFIAQEL